MDYIAKHTVRPKVRTSRMCW